MTGAAGGNLCPPTVYTRHHRHIVGCGSKNDSYFLLGATTMTPIAKPQLPPVVIGPAIAGDCVVIGCLSTLYIYSLWLPVWIPWWLPEVGPAIQWPPPPSPPPPDGYQPANRELPE
jgi:hypothetical protein